MAFDIFRRRAGPFLVTNDKDGAKLMHRIYRRFNPLEIAQAF
jgi:hypothetical protein